MESLRDSDPRQVGKYTLLGRLGSGGMGDVYLGRSIGGRQVAVKVIRPDLARDRSFRTRFSREVEAARRVSGAFTAPVIDADPDAVLPWLVTGYVRGPSLADAVEQHGPLPVSTVLTLAAGLAEGLAAVHEAGVIHRDLKPSNVLLAEDGPRLIDFGISHAADFSQVTLTGVVIGTPGFMSPEQATGGVVGPTSDIFSLGAVLAFAVTGEGPYGSATPGVRQRRVLNAEPRLDNLPDELRPIVVRCLSTRPADRPTASQLLADLVMAHPRAADQSNWLPAGILPGSGQLPTKPPPTPPAPSAQEPPAREAGWEPTLTTTTPPPEEVVPPLASSAYRQPQREEQPPLAELPFPATGRPVWQEPPQSARPGPPPPWVPPPATDARPRKNKMRRRLWVIAVAAIAAAGTVIGLVVAAPWIPPPVLQPAGLVTSDRLPQSVEFAWSGPSSGPLPDRYEILRDGHEVSSVPGARTKFTDTGLSPGTTYHYTVIAVRGGTRSPTSSTLTVTTTTPPPADAVLNLSGTVSLLQTVGDFTEPLNGHSYERNVGDTWQETWSFAADCTKGPCNSTLSGDITGSQLSIPLSRNGLTYSGSVASSNSWSCKGTDVNSTLHVQVTGGHPRLVGGVWTLTSFTGTLVWDVDWGSACASFTPSFTTQVHSA